MTVPCAANCPVQSGLVQRRLRLSRFSRELHLSSSMRAGSNIWPQRDLVRAAMGRHYAYSPSRHAATATA